MDLYIANKNYSSWSLRAWLVMKKFNISFTEHNLKLETPSFSDTLATIAPIAKVPVLVDGSTTIWDSLAICEYINEAYLCNKGWPSDPQQRAKARALAAEMHAGFNSLRNQLPMNIRAKRKVELTAQSQNDIARIEQIFSEQHTLFQHQGGWLFGDWGIVDAMFAPIALRFKTYGISLNAPATAYMHKVLSCSVLAEWIDLALQETEIVQMDEAGEEV
ncbi:glutathione S-transferase family protein [Pseudoalteromonas spongiae]|uniref:glutathione S-transferase family protein n=1 Tax=Pseudoalteromonas spongiae TaxID=298657 RepID=UPI00026CA470|nr:glutathione S-transferase family protein [Pseudoalteromonas spongiae]ATC97411.1 glutathione S-transferase [Pseudoalteromonas spongiae UST010723-006]